MQCSTRRSKTVVESEADEPHERQTAQWTCEIQDSVKEHSFNLKGPLLSSDSSSSKTDCTRVQEWKTNSVRCYSHSGGYKSFVTDVGEVIR